MNFPLKDQTATERFLMCDPAILEGLLWGKPRPGHDEGEIYKHVEFVWSNIDRLSIPAEGEPTHVAVAERNSDLWKRLRLIALMHDTFKYQVDPKQSKSGENHHAMRARRHAEKYTISHENFFDTQMLEVLELHDEAYNAWCKGSRDDKWEKAKTRVAELYDRLERTDSLDLFTMFYTCDTHIGDVERPDWEWWLTYCRNRGKKYEYFLA